MSYVQKVTTCIVPWGVISNKCDIHFLIMFFLDYILWDLYSCLNNLFPCKVSNAVSILCLVQIFHHFLLNFCLLQLFVFSCSSSALNSYAVFSSLDNSRSSIFVFIYQTFFVSLTNPCFGTFSVSSSKGQSCGLLLLLLLLLLLFFGFFLNSPYSTLPTVIQVKTVDECVSVDSSIPATLSTVT